MDQAGRRDFFTIFTPFIYLASRLGLGREGFPLVRTWFFLCYCGALVVNSDKTPLIAIGASVGGAILLFIMSFMLGAAVFVTLSITTGIANYYQLKPERFAHNVCTFFISAFVFAPVSAFIAFGGVVDSPFSFVG